MHTVQIYSLQQIRTISPHLCFSKTITPPLFSQKQLTSLPLPLKNSKKNSPACFKIIFSRLANGVLIKNIN